jgi:hypothetical protein
MTLNSTGLGVNVTPVAAKLQVALSAVASVPAAGATGHNFAFGSVPFGLAGGALSSGNSYLQATRWDGTATNYDLLIQPNGGNVGIGVTPSAWGSMRAVQVLGASFVGDVTINRARVISNAYYNGSDYVYLQNNFAGMYVQNAANGTHSWSIAPSGIAGNTITGANAFVQAMTLDASGNLLVGKTAASVTTVGFQTLPSGEASVAMTATTGAATTLNVYSTGAAAYRFFVGMNGTISATNTTISAISDARFKENVQDIDVGLGAILALKPRKFDWKAGKGKDIKGDRGFIAQEFEQVFPQLVDEWKDPAPEGEAPYKSVRQDLIPVLVKAIQELSAEVNALKNA